MNTVIRKYVDMAKDCLEVKSDAKVAESIGITRSGLSKIIKGGPASQDTLGKLARICSVRPEKLIAEYELSKPHTPQIKSMWRRIGGYAAVWAMLSITLLFTAVTPSRVEAAQSADDQSIVIMLNYVLRASDCDG